MSEKRLQAAVLLPLGKIYEAIYETVIRKWVQEMGGTVIRVAPEFSKADVREQSISQIAAATLLIADVTARNPHVHYLLGYADALEKKSILLAQQGEDFPFDLRSRPIVIYGSALLTLGEELRRAWAGFDNFTPGVSAVEGASSALSEPRQQFLSVFREILDQHGYVHQGRITREGENVFVIEDQEMPLALVQDLARRAKSSGYRLKFF
jgi:hypothetical protein